MSKEIIPIELLKPVIQKQILLNLKRYTFEEHVLALLMKTMLAQLDEVDKCKDYVQKQLKALNKILQATVYVNGIVNASNTIWGDTFKELPINTSIAGFCKSIAFRKPKQFKKMGVNIKAFIKLDKVHDEKGITFQTLKVVNLMLEKLKVEVAKDDLELKEYRLRKKALSETN